MDSFEFSVKCGSCDAVHTGKATNSLVFIAGAQVEGWEVPGALENKPIKCPTCKAKP